MKLILQKMYRMEFYYLYMKDRKFEFTHVTKNILIH